MNLHTLRCVQWLPADIDSVWSFYTKTQNFAAISPDDYSYEVDSSHEQLTKNSTFTIVVQNKKFSLSKINWMGSVSHFSDEPSKKVFIDVQDKGPFSYWKHTHKFVAARASYPSATPGKNIEVKHPGVWVYDTIEYQLPMRAIGEWANDKFVRKRLKAFFSFRKKKLWEIFT